MASNRARWSSTTGTRGGRSLFARAWRSLKAQQRDVVGPIFGEPQVLVGAGDDPVRVAVRSRDRVLGDDSFGGDLPDLVAIDLCEPQVAVGAGGDSHRAAQPGDRVLDDALPGLRGGGRPGQD